MNNLDETLDVGEAAVLLRAEPATIMHLARRGQLPGTRIGKAWVFLREDVLNFLRLQIAADTEARRHQAANAIVAIAVPVPRDSRRRVAPVLPPLPEQGPPNKHLP